MGMTFSRRVVCGVLGMDNVGGEGECYLKGVCVFTRSVWKGCCILQDAVFHSFPGSTLLLQEGLQSVSVLTSELTRVISDLFLGLQRGLLRQYYIMKV